MLLTITTTHRPATDLGFLLHKNPAAVRSVDLSFGRAHVFYPEATEERCTAALLVEIDPVALVRGRSGGGGPGDQYVNDRPYVASSFLSVALGELFGSALGGRSKERPDLAASALPLELRIPALPCRGGESLLRRLFEPLGWSVEVETHLLDEEHPAWGKSRILGVTLRGEQLLADALAHVHVLVPVLDDLKHYWVGDDEIEKLLRRGERWLAAHPERELIAHRYLKHQGRLTRRALERLTADEGVDPDEEEAQRAAREAELERPLRLDEVRIAAVVAALEETGARSVVDLGCGEGRLLRELLKRPRFSRLVGLDVSQRSLERAAERLHLDSLSETRRKQVELLQGSLTYRDARLAGFDAAVCVEVIEHLDPGRLGAFERVLFECARPGVIVLTTPNAEFNAHFPALAAGRFRHPDHRFEWTREQFRAWCGGVGERFGYGVRFAGVGEEHAQDGAPTQMAVFTRRDADGRGTSDEPERQVDPA